MDISDFQTWQAAGPNRAVKIEIRSNWKGIQETSVWVYDSGIPSGQYVQSVEDIDLEAERDKQDRQTWERLQKKFGEAA